MKETISLLWRIIHTFCLKTFKLCFKYRYLHSHFLLSIIQVFQLDLITAQRSPLTVYILRINVWKKEKNKSEFDLLLLLLNIDYSAIFFSYSFYQPSTVMINYKERSEMTYSKKEWQSKNVSQMKDFSHTINYIQDKFRHKMAILYIKGVFANN